MEQWEKNRPDVLHKNKGFFLYFVIVFFNCQNSGCFLEIKTDASLFQWKMVHWDLSTLKATSLLLTFIEVAAMFSDQLLL